MSTKKRLRQPKRVATLRGVGVAAILLAAVATLGVRQSMNDPNLGLVAGIFVLSILLIGGCLYALLLYVPRK